LPSFDVSSLSDDQYQYAPILTISNSGVYKLLAETLNCNSPYYLVF